MAFRQTKGPQMGVAAARRKCRVLYYYLFTGSCACFAATAPGMMLSCPGRFAADGAVVFPSFLFLLSPLVFLSSSIQKISNKKEALENSIQYHHLSPACLSHPIPPSHRNSTVPNIYVLSAVYTYGGNAYIHDPEPTIDWTRRSWQVGDI